MLIINSLGKTSGILILIKLQCLTVTKQKNFSREKINLITRYLYRKNCFARINK